MPDLTLIWEIGKQAGPWALVAVLLVYVYFGQKGTTQQLKGHDEMLENHIPHIEEYIKETRDTLININSALAKQAQRLEDIWNEVRK